MAAVLPSQAFLTRFTVRHPRQLLIIRTVRSRSGTRTRRRLSGFAFDCRIIKNFGRNALVGERRNDAIEVGGRARQIDFRYQERVALVVRPRVTHPKRQSQPRGPKSLSGKSGVTFYLWCTGCRIPFHACLFTGRLVFGRRCSEANCENEGKDCHKAFHGASPSIVLRAEAQQVGRRSSRQAPVKALSRVARCPMLRARLFHAAKATA
jgi:hypothetical protein